MTPGTSEAGARAAVGEVALAIGARTDLPLTATLEGANWRLQGVDPADQALVEASSATVLAATLPAAPARAWLGLALTWLAGLIATFTVGGLLTQVLALGRVSTLLLLMDDRDPLGPLGLLSTAGTLLLGGVLLVVVARGGRRRLHGALLEPFERVVSGRTSWPPDPRPRSLLILVGWLFLLGVPGLVLLPVQALLGTDPHRHLAAILGALRLGLAALFGLTSRDVGRLARSRLSPEAGRARAPLATPGATHPLLALAVDLPVWATAGGIGASFLRQSLEPFLWDAPSLGGGWGVASAGITLGALGALLSSPASRGGRGVLVAGLVLNALGVRWLGPWPTTLLSLAAVVGAEGFRARASHHRWLDAARVAVGLNLGLTLGRILGGAAATLLFGPGADVIGAALGENLLGPLVAVDQRRAMVMSSDPTQTGRRPGSPTTR